MGRTAAVAVFFTAGLVATAFLAGALVAVLVTFLAGAFALVAMVKIRMLGNKAALATDVRHHAPDDSGNYGARMNFYAV
ncbi:hypothetical protein L499_A2453 [Bordetella holmesii CDC-H635-BH]|nr:hypothetical protein L499_A2453 [Bordetella holmesii CDC-H635-BH]